VVKACNSSTDTNLFELLRVSVTFTSISLACTSLY
jgi:hypothetical protein